MLRGVRSYKLGDWIEVGDQLGRVAGMLRDVRALLTTRSRLRRQILVSLHGAGIEIMSPLVVARRPLREGERLVPDTPIPPADVVPDADMPELLIFERTREVEEARRRLQKIEAEI